MMMRYSIEPRFVSAQEKALNPGHVGATRWFSGEKRKVSSEKVPSRKWYISHEAAGRLTLNDLGCHARKTRAYFDAGMPPGYSLRQSKPSFGLIPGMPHLGWCSFAMVRLFKADGTPCLIRFHYGNFAAEINTTPGGKLFKLSSPNRSHMYFGVAFSPSEADASQLTIDRSVHHDGVSFMTDDPSKALDAAIRLRTGISADEWRKLAAAKAAAAKKRVA